MSSVLIFIFWDYLFISFQIHRDFSAQLEERDFTHFGVILGREDAFFGIEQALLCLTHFDTGQISQEITLFGYLVERVYAHLDANESPVTTTVDVPLTKGDDGWVTSVSGNESFFSALYGGSNVVSGLAAPAEDGASQ